MNDRRCRVRPFPSRGFVRFRAAAGCAFILAFCVSCWLPPFDEDVNNAELVVRKLGAPARSFSAYMKSYESSSGYYLPPRDPAAFREGVWVVSEDGELRFRGIFQDTATLVYRATQYNSWSCPDRYGENTVVMPAAAANSVFYVCSTDSSGFTQLQRDASGSLYSMASYPLPGQVGAGVFPSAVLADRYCAVVASAGVLSVVYEQAGSTETFTGSNIITPGYSASLPASPAFAALSSGSNLYLSATLADGSVSTFKWLGGAWAGEPTRLDFVDRQVNGVFSDGRLFARDEDSLTVYDPSDTTSFTITSGKLRFLYERYDSASALWLCVFSRTTSVASNQSDTEIEHRIEIYEIPTADLKSLAD